MNEPTTNPPAPPEPVAAVVAPPPTLQELVAPAPAVVAPVEQPLYAPLREIPQVEVSSVAVADHPAQGVWLDASAFLPPFDLLVLAVSPSGALSVLARNFDSDGWVWAQQQWTWNLNDPAGLAFEDDYEVAHWMPLPVPPSIDAARAG